METVARVCVRPQKKVQIDFTTCPNSDTWTMVCRGEGDIICDPAPKLLKVNPAKINRTRTKDGFIDKYRGNYPEWKEFFNDIGAMQ
jgi:hypothetical protein